MATRRKSHNGLFGFGTSAPAKKKSKGSKMLYADAVKAARKEGARSGDTGEFEPWLERNGLDVRSDMVKAKLREAFRAGVEYGEGSSKGDESPREPEGKGTRYRGVVIRKVGEGYRVSTDPDSEFESLSEAKRFVLAQRNPKSYWDKDSSKQGPFEYVAKLLPSGEVDFSYRREEGDDVYKRRYAGIYQDFDRDMRDKFGSKFASKIVKKLKSSGSDSKRNPTEKKHSTVRTVASGVSGFVAGAPDALIDLAEGAEKFLSGAAGAVFKAAEHLTKRNPKGKKKGKRNPEDGAVSMYEKFHGREPKEILEFKEQFHVHEWLAGLGTLIELKVNTVTGKDATLETGGTETLLASNEEGNQLYIVGGDQSIDLPSLGFNKAQCNKEMVTVGFIFELTYRTEKDFENFESVDFYHELSEDSGDILPSLVYDVRNKQMMMSGGSYHIKKPLLGTSPGIED